MKTAVRALLVFSMLSTWSAACYGVESETCRCNNGIVSKGDTMVEVVMKCGEPTLKTQREEKRGGTETKKGFSIVTVDEWSYNFGPDAFMYSLRFVNGRVEKIESLDYGY